MDVFIDPGATAGLASQIYEAIRSGILEGRLGSGDRLPPSRELAETLGVARSTVTTAYGHLAAEGFLEGRRGGGTVVAELFGADAAGDGFEQFLDLPYPDPEQSVALDLRPGTPDPRLFPVAEWKRYTRWAIDRHDATYGNPAGVTSLRLVLARWIGRSRGVEANFRQLVVTSGAQQAFFLLTATCVDPGDIVAVEDPGYDRFRRLAEGRMARIAPIPVDSDGIVVAEIPTDAKLVYVTPSHQFPTGVTMSMSRRLELLELARDCGMVIVEDDYDSEFRYTDRPLEPLYRLDRWGLVAYVGSFSKTLSPALRLGYVVVPPDLLPALLELRQQVDWAPSQVAQEALKGYLADGEFDRHLRKTRRNYQQRHSVVVDFLHRVEARGLLRPVASHAGLHVAAHLGDGTDESDVRVALADRGVAVGGLSGYYAGPATTHGLVLGFGRADTRQLTKALTVIDHLFTAT
jgi:GntR family transcriptional regulator/MocR family aminotransferase